jgi:hypothetical protein
VISGLLRNVVRFSGTEDDDDEDEDDDEAAAVVVTFAFCLFLGPIFCPAIFCAPALGATFGPAGVVKAAFSTASSRCVLSAVFLHMIHTQLAPHGTDI